LRREKKLHLALEPVIAWLERARVLPGVMKVISCNNSFNIQNQERNLKQYSKTNLKPEVAEIRVLGALKRFLPLGVCRGTTASSKAIYLIKQKFTLLYVTDEVILGDYCEHNYRRLRRAKTVLE
jgi:hypothetical protein